MRLFFFNFAADHAALFERECRKLTKSSTMYIHERDNWTDFRWDANAILLPLEQASHKLGSLYGQLGQLGFDSRLGAMAENLTHDIVYSSEIEGINLNADQVRSSIALRLGIESTKFVAPSHYIDAVVAVMLDAVEHYDRPITKQILCGWQTAFFPTGFSAGEQIETGRYRSHDEHIISGYLGRERVHYVAPKPDRIETEMSRFIEWFNSETQDSYLIRSAIAHFWFVSIHPFEDGNGRLARILSDMMLARGEKSKFRFYNISSAINSDKKHYYEILERAQKGNGDLTEWIQWYITTLIRALDTSAGMLNLVLNKAVFWNRAHDLPMTERQKHTINLFLDGYESKITTKQWAALNKCSKDTANRDIQDLVQKHVLKEEVPGAKRPSYAIVYIDSDISPLFSQIQITGKGNATRLLTTFQDSTPIDMPIQALDAERYEKGELPASLLLNKYCAYLVK